MLETSMGPSTNPLKPTRWHIAWSVLFILGWLSFAGFMATWLFSHEIQERIIAAGFGFGPMLLAFFEYRSTFRYDRQSTVLAIWLNGILGVLLSLYMLPHVPRVIWATVNYPSQGHAIVLILYFGIVAGLLTNAYYHALWLERLREAKETECLPDVPRWITLREMGLLLLAIGWMACIAAYFVHLGWNYILLF